MVPKYVPMSLNYVSVCFISSVSVLAYDVLGVAGDLLCQKEEWRQHSAKCEDPQQEVIGNTAWGHHRGIHWLLLSLGDWQTKLLNPLLRPHVTKHTCYSIMPAVLIKSISVDKCCSKSSWKTINPSVVENSSIILAWDCCVILLSESHITSKQKGIMEDNLNMTCLTFSNLLR